MAQRHSTLALVLSSLVARAWTSLVDSLRTQIAGDTRTYRPEKHYMRGPGPQWRAKHPLGRDSA
jgi:hypothetical protein